MKGRRLSEYNCWLHVCEDGRLNMLLVGVISSDSALELFRAVGMIMFVSMLLLMIFW